MMQVLTGRNTGEINHNSSHLDHLINFYKFVQVHLGRNNSIIAKGNIYLSMQVFCENQKHLLEVKHYIKNWERKVDSLLKKIKESNATSVYVLKYKSEFVEIEGNKSKDGETDLELAREKIEDFGNFISDNLILEIECLMNDCGKNFEETKNDSWKKISAALAEQKESILAVKSEVMGMGEILKY